MGGDDAVARPPRDTFQNRFLRVLLGVGHFKNTVVVLLLRLIFVLRIIKDTVETEIPVVIKATKSGEKIGRTREIVEFWL